MARIDEATLFRPDPKLQYAGGRGGGAGGGPAGPNRGNDEDEGPQIAVRERIAEASRSARRRKGLSFVVMMICGALTVLAAIFAPRSYEVESRVLVQRTATLGGQQQQQVYTSPEEMRNIAREYEEQVLARDNIVAIVKQKNLVQRWDDMRQPHRRLLDKINRRLGKAVPSDDERFDTLVATIERRMKVWVDATTVTVRLDWSEPTAARDIVDAAVKNFLDARYEAEVGVIPARLKIQETFVAQAHKDLEVAAGELVRLQKAKDPKERVNLFIPALPAGVKDAPQQPPPEADPILKAKLENVRNQLGVLQDAKLRRIAELNQQLIEKRQTLAEGHPEVIALKQTIAATEHDPPQLAALKAQEREILAEINAKQREAAARAATERANAPQPAPAPRMAAPAAAPSGEKAAEGTTSPKSVQDAQVQFDTASAKYQELVKTMQTLQLEMQTTEAAYKTRYKVTHPAEVPAAPKRPVGLIAVAIGLLATFMAVLAMAVLADRMSGIFFEPRDVRDRLGIPVFATFS